MVRAAVVAWLVGLTWLLVALVCRPAPELPVPISYPGARVITHSQFLVVQVPGDSVGSARRYIQFTGHMVLDSVWIDTP